ncbi:hypothetical protein H310_12487 [Aphanomyces invadans]|uniref:Uncharacterized protein n=1 Tax=Aphanomyces invadans TaxID=157072 RepID=A0A024TI36_9STRA|nr:hypothetical protein H310_12487 [Aphanomyces invadans]ETV93723.1 hypothetical protein H310_12487 [Aphanomyces invadans]|eukprot:XP_008877764.1 hypothetical protein H310_12487 [Aphanomyces invadans]
MGGDGQLHGSALGRVCTVTFPQAHGTPRVILDTEYVCTIGWSFFDHLLVALAPSSVCLRLCHIKNDDDIRWVVNDATLLALFEDSCNQHHTLHAVEDHPSYRAGRIVVESHASPDFSPKLCSVEIARIQEMEEEKSKHSQEQCDDSSVDDIALEDHNLSDIEVKVTSSTIHATNLMNSIRHFFDPKPAMSNSIDDPEPKKTNWWSASTQLFLKPFASKSTATKQTKIPDMTYRYSEPPMRPMSASHQIQFPRMSYNTQPTEGDTTQHNFHISSSWHHHADRMSASMNLPTTKESTMGSFVWI